MKRLVWAIVIAGIVLGVIAVGGGLLVLLAYGVGLLVNPVLHFEPFQVTVLSMAGSIVVGFWVIHSTTGLSSSPSSLMNTDDDDYDEDDYDDDEYIDKMNSFFDVPHWRQLIKPVDFSRIGPDERCPCGSGRKYKNCHGSKQGK